MHLKFYGLKEDEIIQQNIKFFTYLNNMTKEEIIRIGTLMGLSFNENNNFKKLLENGKIVFDGCNGQRFVIESSWEDDKVFEELGRALILFGKRKKVCEIHQTFSMNSDYELILCK